MIKKEFYLFAALSCFALTGCNKATNTDTPDRVPVKFSATTISSNSRAAIAGSGFADGTKVAIYGMAHSDNDYAQSQWTESPFMENVVATINSSGSMIYAPELFFSTTEKHSFFSLFKGNTGEDGVTISDPGAGTPPTISVSLQPTSLTQPDVMLAASTNETKVTAKDGIALNFNHLLTQIRFNIAKSATYTKVVTLTKVSANSYNTATATIDSESLTVGTATKAAIEIVDCTTAPLTITDTQQPIVQVGKTDAAYALLFPGDSKNTVFTFTINGTNYDLTIDEPWEQGKVYTYDITFDKGLKLIVTDWDKNDWGVVLGGSSVIDTPDWSDGGTLNKEVK